jgi:hypothetical protein
MDAQPTQTLHFLPSGRASGCNLDTLRDPPGSWVGIQVEVLAHTLLLSACLPTPKEWESQMIARRSTREVRTLSLQAFWPTQRIYVFRILAHYIPVYSTKHWSLWWGRSCRREASRRLPTSAARVRSQVSLCGICTGQKATGAGFLRVLQFPLSILIPATVPYSSVIRGWYNGPNSGRRTEWTQLTPPQEIKKIRSVFCEVETESLSTQKMFAPKPRSYVLSDMIFQADQTLGSGYLLMTRHSWHSWHRNSRGSHHFWRRGLRNGESPSV